jgi:hypothetical protein
MSRFLKPLRALLKPTRGRRPPAPLNQPTRPRVEALEDRYLMTLPGIIGLPSTPADWINVDYQGLGGPSGFMGQPLSGVNPVGDGVGFYQQFQGGEIFYSPATNAHFVAGAILWKYGQCGGPAQLGYPINDMVGTADGGFHSVFQGSSGTGGQAAIYWSPNTQASLLYGPVYQHWMALGGPSGLGYPTWDEHATNRGDGLACDFWNTPEPMVWHPSGPSTIMYCTTTHSIGALWGPILQKYADLGWEGGVGYPTNDVHATGRGDGQACDFMQGSVPTTIMWCLADGAHPVSGAILQAYQAQGWEMGIGYPTEDATFVANCPATNGQSYTVQAFDTGIIFNGWRLNSWTGSWSTGAFVLPSACRAYYEGEPATSWATVTDPVGYVRGGARPSEAARPNGDYYANYHPPGSVVLTDGSGNYAGQSRYTGDPQRGWMVTDRNGYVLGYVSVYPSSDYRKLGPRDARLVSNYGATMGWVVWDDAHGYYNIMNAYGLVLGRVLYTGNRFEAGAAGLDLLSGFSA